MSVQQQVIRLKLAGLASAASLAGLRHDHDRHGDRLRRLEVIANGFVLPEGACRSWQALYVGTSKTT